MKFEIVPQDEAWGKQAKRNLTALYENKPMERMPFEFAYFDITGEFKPRTETKVSADPKIIVEERRKFFDAELQLKCQLESIAKRVRQGFWDDSVMALHPVDSATGWMTEVFGGETVWFPNRPPYPHPVITEAKDIDKLHPDFDKSEIYQAALTHLRYYRKVVGDKIPIGAPDLQSPIDIVSMIFDYTQLIYAMMDEPNRVYSLMRMITDAVIQACHAFRKEMTDYPMGHFNWWLPRGIFLSDDLQAVLNPELYKEFAVPYNEIIAQEFGGLGLHSCGKIIHNIDNVSATKGLYVFNTHERLADVAPIAKNRCAVILGGIFKVIAPNYPGNDRLSCKTPDELEALWFEDCSRLAEIKGQRFLYQCHVLLYKRKPQEAYDRMLVLSKEAAKNLKAS